MSKEEVIKKLEDYLDGNLSVSERSELESCLRSDATLSEKLRVLQELRAMVARESEEQKLREKLDAASSHHFKQKKVR